MIQIQAVLPTPITRLLHIHKQSDLMRTQRYNALKKDLETAKSNLHTAMTNFDNVTDPKLVDMYIYQIQSAQTQYEHILNEIKNFG